jgi:hypothetical protein
MRKVRLTAGNSCDIKLIIQDLSFPDGDNKPEIINGWDDDNEDSFIHSTLRDISIVMKSMVGCGVTTQLAEELSKELFPYQPKFIEDILFKIFREYSKLSEEDANDKWDSVCNIEKE